MNFYQKSLHHNHISKEGRVNEPTQASTTQGDQCPGFSECVLGSSAIQKPTTLPNMPLEEDLTEVKQV